MRLEGFAAVYSRQSEDLGGFVEVILPGAFDGPLRDRQDTMCRQEHDSRLLLGRVSNGTLRLESRSQGLWYETDVPDTQAGRDAYALAVRGDLRKSSFAFTADEELWSVLNDDLLLREVVGVSRLVDVAPVGLPAYSQTTVSARVSADLKDARSRLSDARVDTTMRRNVALLAMIGQEIEEDRMRRNRATLERQRQEMRNMEDGVDLAALATNGLRVDRSTTLRRGQLQVGSRVLQELRAGRRAASSLNGAEQRCLRVAQEAEQGIGR